MSIEKMMCLSTGHVTQRTAEEFDLGLAMLAIDDPNERDHDVPAWVNGMVIYPHGEYGWLVCVAGDCVEHLKADPDAFAAIPKDLIDVLEYTHANGCDWLLLDRDADLIDEIPSYDW